MRGMRTGYLMSEPEKCKDCGGDCGPECGRHPAGCIFGGFGYGYWIAMDGCKKNHDCEDPECNHGECWLNGQTMEAKR